MKREKSRKLIAEHKSFVNELDTRPLNEFFKLYYPAAGAYNGPIWYGDLCCDKRPRPGPGQHNKVAIKNEEIFSCTESS